MKNDEASGSLPFVIFIRISSLPRIFDARCRPPRSGVLILPAMHLADATLRVYGHIAPTGRGMFRLARLARRLRPRSRWRDTFTVSGHALDLDLAVYPDCCMAFGVYELDTARWITRLLQPGGHFVDGGANLGYFTLLAAGCVGKAGRVDAFEPVPATRQRLTDHLNRNNLADDGARPPRGAV